MLDDFRIGLPHDVRQPIEGQVERKNTYLPSVFVLHWQGIGSDNSLTSFRIVVRVGPPTGSSCHNALIPFAVEIIVVGSAYQTNNYLLTISDGVWLVPASLLRIIVSLKANGTTSNIGVLSNHPLQDVRNTIGLIQTVLYLVETIDAADTDGGHVRIDGHTGSPHHFSKEHRLHFDD